MLNHSYWVQNECLNIKVCKYLVSNNRIIMTNLYPLINMLKLWVVVAKHNLWVKIKINKVAGEE